MPEGFTAGEGITHGVHDDPDASPPPGPDAPRGWTWDRKGRHWTARQRGPVLWTAEGAAAGTEPDAAADADAAVPGKRDPAPAWQRDDGSKPGAGDDGKKPWDPKSVSAEVKDDIGGMLGLAAAIVLPAAEHADPHCGGALADNFDRIVEKAIPLICRSERVVKWMQAEGGGFMDWIGLGIALAPVGRAVAEHHILKTVEVVEEKDEATGRTIKIAQPVDFSLYTAA